MAEGGLPPDAPTLAQLRNALLQGLFVKSDEQLVDEFVRRCIDIRNDELNEIEQLKLAHDDSYSDDDLFDDEDEPAEWRPGTKLFPRGSYGSALDFLALY